MFEHFYTDELKRLLRECVRVLKDNGASGSLCPASNAQSPPVGATQRVVFGFPQVSDLPHSLYVETFK
jgi:predicted SAM-dependent methyltransferase